jgi:hypothetical protein
MLQTGPYNNPKTTQTTTIHTQRSNNNAQQYSNTAKNWRHLITPAHDSFKKLEKSRRPGVQYSHHHNLKQEDTL